MGDGVLLEFPSVVAAVECAVTIQNMMVERNVDTPEARRIVYRIGVHLGDVLIDGDDILGDGVNIAARLGSICEPGGVSISRAVYDQISGKLALGFRTLGLQKLKNIAKPVEVFAIDYVDKTDDAPTPEDANVAQTIKYCRADGVRLAYAISGSGPFLVKSGNWLNHLEYDWQSPIWGHVFRGLSRRHTLVRYDARGNGMSDWDVDTLSLDAWVTDLETVVDAVGVEHFPILGISQGGAVAVAYAVRRPERVSHLILYGAFALGGKKRSPAEKEMRDAMTTLMRLGWGADNPSFRQMFTARFIPGATHEQADYFNELQRKTTSSECAARYFDVANNVDITDLLSKVKTPTLVMHVRDDQIVPFEAGRQLAAGIPGARFIALPGRNHLFLEHEPASNRFFEEISLFMRG
jgi:pimeloyl-ACP methyl ester carboxylesterase